MQTKLRWDLFSNTEFFWKNILHQIDQSWERVENFWKHRRKSSQLIKNSRESVFMSNLKWLQKIRTRLDKSCEFWRKMEKRQKKILRFLSEFLQISIPWLDFLSGLPKSMLLEDWTHYSRRFSRCWAKISHGGEALPVPPRFHTREKIPRPNQSQGNGITRKIRHHLENPSNWED